MVLFADELIEAYPNTKVILSMRDASKWASSMQESIWLVHSWSTWDIIAPFHTLISLWRKCDTMDWDCFINSSPERPSMKPKRRDYQTDKYRALAIQRFHEHNDHIRKSVPKENLLEFQPQSGWKPLCDFLGHEVPNEEYPRAWDKEALVTAATQMWWFGIATVLVKLGIPFAVAVGVCWWAFKVLA